MKDANLIEILTLLKEIKSLLLSIIQMRTWLILIFSIGLILLFGLVVDFIFLAILLGIFFSIVGAFLVIKSIKGGI